MAANSYFNNAHTRDSREAVAGRKKLATIRGWLKRELQRRDPELEDGWLPYLLAFGLAKDVDRWAVSHGHHVRTQTSTSPAGGGTSPSWTGGGGTFGAAGATTAWTAAATGLAAGVARPGSSGGGGGGGGGGSSGGGGGGGW
jgi:hypothetical protein